MAPHPGNPGSTTGAGDRHPRVVVGIDGSTGAGAALHAALLEAARRGAELDVVAAYPEVLVWTGGSPVDVPDISAVRADTRDRARAFIDQTRAELPVGDVPVLAEVPVHLVVAGGSPAAVLVHQAEGADLLVVGSRGRGAARSALLGSVALHCVTSAPCPVAVVHEVPAARPDGGPVVVGFDGSDASVTALREAMAQAARLGAAVDVVVAHSLADHWADMFAIVLPVDDVRARVLDDAGRTVASLTEEIAAAGRRAPEVRTEMVEGRTHEVLLERARGAAGLVVGSRGHGAVRGLLLGSVALRCVVHAPCPVTVVHPQDTPAPAPRADERAAARG